MGCILGCIAGTVSCCCFNAAAALCCTCLPSCNLSVSTRLMYLLYFTLGFIAVTIMLNLNIGYHLQRIPVICQRFDKTYFRHSINFNYNCTFTANYGGIYRCCFGISVFFFILSLLMIRVRTSCDIRAKFHNGYWCWKFLIYLILIASSMFALPDPYFTSTWFVFGMIGGFLDILIQLVLIVDLAHSWNEKWVEKYESEDSKIYYYGLIGFTSVFYVASLVLFALMLYFFGSHSSCHLHRFLILFNLSLCLLATGVSVTPKVQEHTQRSGLLQASLITTFVSFLTWSALTSSPNQECNPILTGMEYHLDKPIGRSSKNGIPFNEPGISSNTQIYKLEWNYNMIVSIIIFYILLIYFSIRNPPTDSFSNPSIQLQNIENTLSTNPENNLTSTSDISKNKVQVVIDDEKSGVKYDYSLFHFIYCLGAIYIQMILTNWLSFYSDDRVLRINNATTWVKISSSWMCVVLYLWTLIAPVKFPDRDFN